MFSARSSLGASRTGFVHILDLLGYLFTLYQLIQVHDVLTMRIRSPLVLWLSSVLCPESTFCVWYGSHAGRARKPCLAQPETLT